ncbi:MAG: magnesium transporter MgtE N-terminal domain-containing protein, partial [Chloroflexota bacterium]
MTAPEQPSTLPDIQQLHELINRGDLTAVAALLADVHPADIADLLDAIDPQDAVVLFNLLNLQTASEVLDETGSLVRQELLEKVDDEHLADLFDELPMDDAAEFLEDLPSGTASRLLGLMEPEEAQDVRDLLRYEIETAGRLMTTEIAMLRRQWTAAQALDYLRSLTEAETLHYLYVVNRHN